jgi:simple sugar transport system permease protein
MITPDVRRFGAVKDTLKSFGLPRIIIVVFLVLLWAISMFLEIPFPQLLSDTLVRWGMNGVLVLAMMPSILAGTGLYFGLPIGIICGLLGGVIAIELNLVGITAFFAAIAFSIPFAFVLGWVYGFMLNRIKGSEMTVATYVGFSIVSLMCIFWSMAPFKSPAMAWPIGRGLRVTISLADRYEKVLNNFLSFNIFGIMIPTGLILFLLLMCLIVVLFFNTKTGIALKAGGENPRFAQSSGINVDTMRIVGTIFSTVLGAIGILVYSQSFGFIQLYTAPLFMGFLAAAAILIGGASIKKATILHVLLGTFLFQGLLVVALPVANKVATLGSLAEISRIIVSNGVILYALAQHSGD